MASRMPWNPAAASSTVRLIRTTLQQIPRHNTIGTLRISEERSSQSMMSACCTSTWQQDMSSLRMTSPGLALVAHKKPHGPYSAARPTCQDTPPPMFPCISAHLHQTVSLTSRTINLTLFSVMIIGYAHLSSRLPLSITRHVMVLFKVPFSYIKQPFESKQAVFWTCSNLPGVSVYMDISSSDGPC